LSVTFQTPWHHLKSFDSNQNCRTSIAGIFFQDLKLMMKQKSLFSAEKNDFSVKKNSQLFYFIFRVAFLSNFYIVIVSQNCYKPILTINNFNYFRLLGFKRNT